MTAGRRSRSGGLPGGADLRALLFLLLVPLAFYGRGLVPGRVLSTGEIIFRLYPWKAAHPGPVTVDPILNDLPFVFQPWLSFARTEVRAGRLPLWNPHAYCGSPFLGTGQSGVFSPFNVPAYLLPLPTAIGLSAILKCAVAGMGTYWFLRLLALGVLPALLGSLAFMFGGFLTAWLMWPVASAAVWLPALLASVESLRRSGRARDAGLVAAVTALHLFGGHPETSLQLGAASLAWALFRARGPGGARFLGMFALGTVGGALLAGVQVVPFLDYLSRTATFGRREIDPALSAIPWKALLLLLVPRWFGHPGDGTQWELPLANDYSEISVTVGLVPLVLLPCALLGARRAGGTAFFGWAALVLFLAVYHHPGIPPTDLLPSLLARVPGLSQLHPERLLLSLGFCLAVLGALGLDALLRADRRTRARMAATAILTAAILAAVLAAALILDRPAMARAGFAETAAVRAGFAAALLATAGWLARKIALGWKWRAAPAALLAVELAGLGPFALSYIPAMKAKDLLPETPAIAFLRKQPGIFRVLMPAPNVGAVYGLQDVLGYDGLNPRFVTGLLCGPDSLGPRSNDPPRFTRGLGSPLLDLMNCGYLLLPPGSSAPAPKYEPAYSGRDARVWRNTRALPRAWLADSVRTFDGDAEALAEILGGGVNLRREITLVGGRPVGAAAGGEGKAAITGHAPGRVSVRTESAGRAWLFLADSWDPGWRATVDGKPAEIRRADHAFMAVEVGAGGHEVEFRYKPLSFRLGLLLSVLGLIGTAALFRIRG